MGDHFAAVVAAKEGCRINCGKEKQGMLFARFYAWVGKDSRLLANATGGGLPIRIESPTIIRGYRLPIRIESPAAHPNEFPNHHPRLPAVSVCRNLPARRRPSGKEGAVALLLPQGHHSRLRQVRPHRHCRRVRCFHRAHTCGWLLEVGTRQGNC